MISLLDFKKKRSRWIGNVQVLLCCLHSHCPDHKWASARELPGKKSIFSPWSKKDEPAGAEKSVPRSQLGEEATGLKEQCVTESVRSCGLETSQQMEALDLQGVSRIDSGASQMNAMRRAHVIELHQDGNRTLTQEMAGLIVDWCDAFLERTKVLAEGPPVEPSTVAPSQEVEGEARPPELTQDSVKLARKPLANSKVNPKGILVGSKRKKRRRAGIKGGNEPLGGFPSTGDAQSLVSEKPTSASLGQPPHPSLKLSPPPWPRP